MADIADIGFRADTSDLQDAKAALDAIGPAATKAEAGAAKVEKAFTKTGNAATDAAKGVGKFDDSLGKVAAGSTVEASAINRAAAANDNFARSGVAAAAGANAANTGIVRLFATVIGGVVAITGIVAIITGLIVGIAALATSFLVWKQSVGDLTVGMGLTEKQLDRLKQKGTNTGITLSDVFTGLGKTIGETLREAFEGPLKGVKDKWVSTAGDITSAIYGIFKGVLGTIVGTVDAISAVWGQIPAAIGDLFYQGVNGAIDALNGLITFIKDIPSNIYNFFAGIPGFFMKLWGGVVEGADSAFTWMYDKIAGGVDWIANNWKRIPGIIAGAFYDGAVSAITTISWLGSKILDFIKHIAHADFGHITNPFEGAAGKAVADGAKAYADGYDKAGKAVDRFSERLKKNIVLSGQARVRKAAAGAGATHAKKSDPWQDLVEGAQNDIATQTAAAKAVGMSAEAAATLTEKTKLLNEANQKGIKLDDTKRAKIDALAAAYGKAKVQADNAKSLFDITEGAQRSITALNAQNDAIGLVGRGLAYQTEMTRLLAEAEAKHLPITDAVRTSFEKLANTYADATASGAAKRYYTDAIAAANENIDTLKVEAATLGMSQTSINAATYAQKLLNDEKYRGIILGPQQRADLIAAAAEQDRLTQRINQTRDAMDFAKDAARGFVSDLRGNLQQGQNLFQAFGNAVLNVLNKVLDKLLDVALNAAMGSGGGVGGFLQGLFGGGAGATPNFATGTFAKGASFGRNGIVDHPTLFAFAKGAAMGVMGEAGPEAVMPLKRGPDGSLGVQMHGTGGGGSNINAPVNISNSYAISGAVSAPEIIALVRQAGEQTKQDVKANLMPWIDEYQRNGTL